MKAIKNSFEEQILDINQYEENRVETTVVM